MPLALASRIIYILQINGAQGGPNRLVAMDKTFFESRYFWEENKHAALDALRSVKVGGFVNGLERQKPIDGQKTVKSMYEKFNEWLFFAVRIEGKKGEFESIAASDYKAQGFEPNFLKEYPQIKTFVETLVAKIKKEKMGVPGEKEAEQLKKAEETRKQAQQNDGQINLAGGGISASPVHRDFVVDNIPFEVQQVEKGNVGNIVAKRRVDITLDHPVNVRITQLPGLKQPGCYCGYYALYFFWCLETGRIEKISNRAYYDTCEQEWMRLTKEYRVGEEEPVGELDWLSRHEMLNIIRESKFLKDMTKFGAMETGDYFYLGIELSNLKRELTTFADKNEFDNAIENIKNRGKKWLLWKLERGKPKCFILGRDNHWYAYKAEIKAAGNIELTAVHSLGYDVRYRDVTQEFAYYLALANQK